MRQDQLKQILKQLNKQRGQLIGMTVGSGLFYKYAVMNQIDLLLVLSASRFRQMGISSLAGSMPFGNSNDMVLDFALREIMPNDPKIPVIFGLCATDPTIVIGDFLERLISYGFSGVCNLPSISIIDGSYREALKEVGFSYESEVRALAQAHEMGLLTVGMVRDVPQAKLMVQAGCDIICVYLGAASGGVLGAKLEVNLKNATNLIKSIFEACKKEREDIILMIYGGPAKTPSSINYLTERTHADGFFGGYTFERLMVERIFSEGAIKNMFLCKEKIPPKQRHKNYSDYLCEYIENNYMHKISFSQLSEQLHISRTYLSSVFKRETGESFMDYLISYRMHKASNLLINTDLPINDIVFQVGYSDYAHFSKVFKNKMGISPANYRRQYKNT